MGERAQQGYEDAEREAFKRLPASARLKANAVAILVTGGFAFFVFMWLFRSV